MEQLHEGRAGTTRSTLVWLERGLATIGAVLAVYCGAVFLEMRAVSSMAVPPPVAANSPAEVHERATPRARPPVASGTWVARLDAPSARFSATVLEGSSDEVLRRGAGHIEDTAFPGEPGNVGIAGHRDTTFRPVRHLRVGDALDMTTAGAVLHYRIKDTRIVDPGDVWVLDPTSDSTLTLVTCYPFTFIGHAPRRFIVQAVLVSEEKRLGS